MCDIIFTTNRRRGISCLKMGINGYNEGYVLVIEDEVPIADVICYSLKREGIFAEAQYTGETGLARFKEKKPDLVILDIMLPGINGYDICTEITSKYSVPVILLTSKSNVIDKVRGFELGADDYITKPFDVLELLARVKTALRRVKRYSSEEIIWISPSVFINTNQRKAIKGDKKVELTPKEYELVLFLASNRGKVFSRENILDNVWGYDFFGDKRTVDIHIRRLRKKLDENEKESFIETSFGTGYMIPKRNNTD